MKLEASISDWSLRPDRLDITATVPCIGGTSDYVRQRTASGWRWSERGQSNPVAVGTSSVLSQLVMEHSTLGLLLSYLGIYREAPL